VTESWQQEGTRGDLRLKSCLGFLKKHRRELYGPRNGRRLSGGIKLNDLNPCMEYVNCGEGDINKGQE